MAGDERWSADVELAAAKAIRGALDDPAWPFVAEWEQLGGQQQEMYLCMARAALTVAADAGLLPAGAAVREEWAHHPDHGPIHDHRCPDTFYVRTVTVHTGPWRPLTEAVDDKEKTRGRV